MSFLNKSMSNRFPEWSKIKQNESSVGGIIFDILGRNIENLRMTGLNYKTQKKVFENIPLLTHAKSFRVSLPNYPLDIENRIISSLRWESSEGPLEVYTSWSEYNLELPDSFEIKKINNFYTNIIQSFNIEKTKESYEETIDFQMKGKYLIFDCRKLVAFENENSDSFGKVFSENREIQIRKNYCIIVRGKDIHGKSIEEIIKINKKDIYKTKNMFTRICSLKKESLYTKQREIVGGPALEFLGFEGEVILKEYDFKSDFLILKDRLSITNYNPFEMVYPRESYIENHLKLRLKSSSEMEMIHSFFKNDYDFYIKNNYTDQSSGEEVLIKYDLFDNNDNVLEINDIAYNEKNKKLYGISKNKVLYIWEVEKPKLNFNNLIQETKETDLEIQQEKNFNNLNEKVGMNLILTRPKSEIYQFFILRYKPSSRNINTDWEVEFLNKDREWQSDVSFFKGNDRKDKFENIVNFKFFDTLEEYGQYDYYVISYKKIIEFESKEDLRKQFQKLATTNADGFTCSRTSTMVSKLYPIRSYDLSQIPNSVENNYLISFKNITNELLIKADMHLVELDEISNKIFFDYARGVAFFQKAYSELKIKMVLSGGIDYECEVAYE